MRKVKSLFLLMILAPFLLLAQTHHTLSGFVKESSTGEMLLGANIYVKPSLKGTQTNQYGFFSLTIPDGKYTLVISYVGFKQAEMEVTLDKDIHKVYSLESASIQTQEVVVSAERSDHNVS